MSKYKLAGLILGCFLAGIIGLFVGLQTMHVLNDHAVLHELARREALREQGQNPYAPAATPQPQPAPPASKPPTK